MLEKILLAITITFSLSLLLKVELPSNKLTAQAQPKVSAPQVSQIAAQKIGRTQPSNTF